MVGLCQLVKAEKTTRRVIVITFDTAHCSDRNTVYKI